jgi:uncharacterized protein YjbI with pentapeptide repeats
MQEEPEPPKQIERTRPLLLRVGLVFLILCSIVALILIGYQVNWTGFGRLVSPQVQNNQGFTREKTLWDWLDLLIIPIVLAVGGFLLNREERKRERQAADQRAAIERRLAEERAEVDRHLAHDNAQELALETYLDRMSDLTLREGLMAEEPSEAVRNVARVRTLTILRRLDGMRKATVIGFLAESGLIAANKPIINLRGAAFANVELAGEEFVGIDLCGVDLSGANLAATILSIPGDKASNLSQARLQRANLRHAWLRGADLSMADLTGADLSGADLSEANLKAAKFTGAVLRKAQIRNAVLTDDQATVELFGADITQANFVGADITEADFTGSTVTIEQLESAKLFDGVKKPDGSTYPLRTTG